MNYNNFTDNDNIPVAIPVNSNDNIPIAWPVNSDDNIPVALPVNEFETALPIAVPVDNSIQERQIAELERANIQMADKLQAQQIQIQREQAKQQEAQQKLQQVQKEKELENQFNLTQMRLIEEYTNRINLALEYRAIGNFDRAIQQYQLSLDSMNQLRDAKRALGFGVMPEFYYNYTYQSHLAIANCLIEKGNLIAAYDALYAITPPDDNRYLLEARRKECHDLIYKHAQKIIADVKSMPTRGNPQQIYAAKELLKDAKSFLTRINKSADNNFLTQQEKLEWDTIRDRTNKECQDLLNSCFDLDDYATVAPRARSVVESYANYSKLLDFHERGYQEDIANLLPRLEQVAAQLKINDLRPTVETCLASGDILGACLTMHQIYNLALEIKNPSYIQQKGLIYQNPQSYYLQLQNLEVEAQQFKFRANEKHNSIVDKIIEVVLNKLSVRTSNASLFEKDLKELRAALSFTIKNNWNKFDHRPIPLDLINNIAEKIFMDCEDIGTFKRWYNWSNATSCLKNAPATLSAVKQQISDYAPIIPPEVVVNLNNAVRFRP